MAREKAKGKLSQIVEPLQKLLDQRAELDKRIEEMKKTLITAIENEDAPVKQTGKGPKAPKAKKVPAKGAIEKKPRGRKPKAKEAEES